MPTRLKKAELELLSPAQRQAMATMLDQEIAQLDTELIQNARKLGANEALKGRMALIDLRLTRGLLDAVSGDQVAELRAERKRLFEEVGQLRAEIEQRDARIADLEATVAGLMGREGHEEEEG